MTAPDRKRERGRVRDRVPRVAGSGSSGGAQSGLPGGTVAAEDDDRAHDGQLGCLPAPPAETVRAARAYLTPRYAAGADAFLWEAMELPLPDLECVDAVSAASDLARRGGGDQPGAMEAAAALVVLSAARLDIDRAEARLLEAAQHAAMGWEQIAAILGVSVADAEERYRRLKPRLDEPIADSSPCRGGH